MRLDFGSCAHTTVHQVNNIDSIIFQKIRFHSFTLLLSFVCLFFDIILFFIPLQQHDIMLSSTWFHFVRRINNTKGTYSSLLLVEYQITEAFRCVSQLFCFYFFIVLHFIISITPNSSSNLIHILLYHLQFNSSCLYLLLFFLNELSMHKFSDPVLYLLWSCSLPSKGKQQFRAG